MFLHLALPLSVFAYGSYLTVKKYTDLSKNMIYVINHMAVRLRNENDKSVPVPELEKLYGKIAAKAAFDSIIEGPEDMNALGERTILSVDPLIRLIKVIHGIAATGANTLEAFHISEKILNPFIGFIANSAFNSGNLTVAKALIKFGFDVNSQDSCGHTPLANALISHSEDEFVKFLIEADADVNLKDSAGYTPIFYGVFSYKLNEIKLLIEAGADVNAKSEDGHTPLQLAIDGNKPEPLIKLLKEVGAKTDAELLDKHASIEIANQTVNNTANAYEITWLNLSQLTMWNASEPHNTFQNKYVLAESLLVEPVLSIITHEE
jgi:ankyrin repeat protein